MIGTRLLFDLTHLALQTDSTRLITIMLAGSTAAPPIDGVNLGHHDLSHHGKDPGKLAQLKIVETEAMKTVRDLLGSSANRRKMMGTFWTARPFFSAAISAMPAAIRPGICPCCSRAADSSTGNICISIRRTHRLCATFT